ncbi:MAG: cell wall-active antibiotics response protein [Lachnospiraceae bacterium]|nr:cell wall-active antibiotics response protein [Lachnospiraceae bacterium]
MKKNSNIFWGLILILIAIYLVASKFVNIPSFSFFTIVLTLFFAYGVISGLRHGSFLEAVMSLAFLGCIYDKELGITAITPWTLLLSAALLGIGLDKIFKGVFKKKRWSVNITHNDDNIPVHNESIENGNFNMDNVFGTNTKYFAGEELVTIEANNAFGNVNLYFDKAILPSNLCIAEINNTFGNINLYIPKDWEVRIKPSSFCGAVINKHESSTETTNVIEIDANTAFGSIKIF